ncbi:hypothetical protein ACH47V_25020 [Micromonospora chersina]|uniref:hypothetical protein n=1 Tax=Micromonospora chersina TaxID=47854 RepID=UPI00340CCD1B
MAGATSVLAVSGTFKCVLVYGSSTDEVSATFTEIKARPIPGLPASHRLRTGCGVEAQPVPASARCRVTTLVGPTALRAVDGVRDVTAMRVTRIGHGAASPSAMPVTLDALHDSQAHLIALPDQGALRRVS